MDNYSQVEWLSNNASSSYIELDYYPSSTTKIEVDAAFLSGGSGSFIFGIFSGSSNKAYWANVTADYLYFRTYKATVASNIVYDYHNYLDETKRNYIFGNGFIIVDGITTGTADTQTYSSLGYKLNWFKGYNSGQSVANQKVYEIKIYENDVLLKNYIPVIRHSDRRVGLYEKISGVFFVAPTTFTYGKILENYTENMELRVGFSPNETTHYFISENSLNFKNIDSYYTAIKNKDITLNALVEKIAKRFTTDASEKEAIWKVVNSKLDIVENKELVANTLITKLDEDYTKAKLDSIFASTGDLTTKIEKICDELMSDYYTKKEVDELVEKGGGGSMENYYTKTEIDEKIPDKEDLSIIQKFLESRTAYYDNLRTFTKLNGKGE